MRQFLYIVLFLLSIGCSNNRAEKFTSKEQSSTAVESEAIIKEVITPQQAYTEVIFQKLKDIIETRQLHIKHPEFPKNDTLPTWIHITPHTLLKNIEIIDSVAMTDSITTVKTKLNFERQKTDTIISIIKRSTVFIDTIATTSIQIDFEKTEKKQPSVTYQKEVHTPLQKEKFSLKDLNFSWEDIDNCDCLFSVNVEDTPSQKIFFGRLNDDTHGILQVGIHAASEKIQVTTPRNTKRAFGSSWKETYKNSHYNIRITATPETSKFKDKYAYSINFFLRKKTDNTLVRKNILVHCKS
ncbi:hypothetical protein HN014_02350 [Aquimarina sp. TRL1]|uniref:hypothetical protein n=1 Tax=Aquimarina sp. (strain TRL1) TaxID=2736252 RepID=UPI00158E71E5|nr:hypothetical protein [Aquimarina sp. TRL1]QKX03806.1 hypothetical protein HN014_02350 [Aquimarina sp. TRL1]